VKSLHNFSQYVFIEVSSNNDNTGIEEAAGHVEDAYDLEMSSPDPRPQGQGN
jgi:hypothetical protein